jgi:hypothetical protein
MTPVTRPRGRLPARVYWFRRLLVVALAFALVYGVAHLLGSGDGTSSGPSARPVAADASTRSAPATTALPTPSVTEPPEAVATSRVRVRKHARAAATPTVLATPEGPCTPSDVTADPEVPDAAYAGTPVKLTIALTSRVSPACTMEVRPGTLAVRITSGSDRIWSSQDCPAAIPTSSVVVRRDVPATVRVTWNGQRSDADCTDATAWALHGYYHVTAAVLGGDPTDQQFALAPAATPTVTKTPKPARKKH